jgi:hypothetical protein
LFLSSSFLSFSPPSCPLSPFSRSNLCSCYVANFQAIALAVSITWNLVDR